MSRIVAYSLFPAGLVLLDLLSRIVSVIVAAGLILWRSGLNFPVVPGEEPGKNKFVSGSQSMLTFVRFRREERDREKWRLQGRDRERDRERRSGRRSPAVDSSRSPDRRDRRDRGRDIDRDRERDRDRGRGR